MLANSCYGLRVNERLGEGAFGEVYKMDSPLGFHPQDPIVAVKKIAVSHC